MEDKKELADFLNKLKVKGYERLWAPNRLTEESENIGRHLDSVRRFNKAIPPEALAADGEHLYPLWAYMNLKPDKDTDERTSIEICIDHSQAKGFHVSGIYMNRFYGVDDMVTAGVTIASPGAGLPDLGAMLRLTDKTNQMRKKRGQNRIERKFNSEDKIVKSCLGKKCLRQ